ncbi:MAG: LysM peptidoglycan-binding domain-containing protein [Porphyromonadaceae bacterium]|nr:LysM peptidoglycan-binding domain-containing protein [Porphyromonadaceae bacterium]
MNIKGIRLRVALLLLLGWSTTQSGLGQTKRGRLVEHTVSKSETVYGIAKRYGTSVEKVYELNPWAKDKIKDGDKLLVPTTVETTTIQESLTKEVRTHRIEAGETVYRICRMYDITEEMLLRANPGISSNNFPIGLELRIPVSIEHVTDSLNQFSSREAQRVSRQAIKVLLMLPFKGMPRHIEFYEGFLMGMNDLKKDGISINLTALDIPDLSTLRYHVSSGILYGHDLVIGGVSEEQIQLIASKMPSEGLYVVPFNSQEYNEIDASNFVRVNQPAREVVARAVPKFLEKYRGYKVYLAGRSQDREEPFAEELKKALGQSDQGVRYLDLDRQTSINDLPARSVVVPVSSSRELGMKLFSSISPNSCTIFGYPQWQSYGADFLDRARRYNATIFSSFFFDPESPDGKHFLTKYRAWFNKKTGNNYPKFSVLGYDMARYFIRGYASLGFELTTHSHLLPSDGLQLDIELARMHERQSFGNTKFYFVTYTQDGFIQRISL